MINCSRWGLDDIDIGSALMSLMLSWCQVDEEEMKGVALVGARSMMECVCKRQT